MDLMDSLPLGQSDYDSRILGVVLKFDVQSTVAGPSCLIARCFRIIRSTGGQPGLEPESTKATCFLAEASLFCELFATTDTILYLVGSCQNPCT